MDLQLAAAMPSKLKTFRYRETCGEFNNRVSKHARVVEAHESTKTFGKNSTGRSRRSHYWKGVRLVESLQSCLSTSSVLCSNDENPGRRRRCGKKWEKLEKWLAWQLSKEKEQEGAQKEQRTVHFTALMDICHLKNVEPIFQEYKVRVVLRGDFCERRFWL